ncbi:endochitinase [Cannabis sativa]|uniref:Chitin-binding type-1 domain-containing protein n=1 Tax=Cannabis sativa TaxID=3483 RepID=A0A7J6EFZ4_CANSA|nr:endochitinase [Cannabis sativa]KAF4357226.1 hypothetical protein F8388_017438 [Cannabis sativa]KAF4403773.1 hypothetical protein G4B88_002626 [Cannabis sativa]
MKHYYLCLCSIITALFLLVNVSSYAVAAGECGKDAGGALCAEGFCCSNYGYCGQTDDYCAPDKCQSQCPTPSPPPPPSPPSPPPPPFTPPPPASPEDISNIITPSIFEEMLTYRNDPRCKSNGFYAYDAFITAARNFPSFGTTGTLETRKRELAAFLAQTSHETTGGWSTAEGGPYAWGYCFISEVGQPGSYCVPSTEWPCVPGKKYYGRGPIQISYNYNYGPAGQALGLELLSNPDLVATDAVVSFKTAIWFWMTPQYNKPSCHDVIVGEWIPTPADVAANRLPGYGVITNIINGGLECGHGEDDRVKDRIGFYERYCGILGVSTGENVDCYYQHSFGFRLMNARSFGVIKMSVDE